MPLAVVVLGLPRSLPDAAHGNGAGWESTQHLLCALQKLLQLSGDRLGSGLEKEEVQFAAVLCMKIKQDPTLLTYILEVSSPWACGAMYGVIDGVYGAFPHALQLHPQCTAPQGEGDEGSGCDALPLQGKSIPNGTRAQELPAMAEGTEHPSSTATGSPRAGPSPPRRDRNLITSLVGLCKSKVQRKGCKEGPWCPRPHDAASPPPPPHRRAGWR